MRHDRTAPLKGFTTALSEHHSKVLPLQTYHNYLGISSLPAEVVSHKQGTNEVEKNLIFDYSHVNFSTER